MSGLVLLVLVRLDTLSKALEQCLMSRTDGWTLSCVHRYDGPLSCVHRWMVLVLCPQMDGPCLVSTARWISSYPICLLGILGDWRLLLGVLRLLDDGRQAATVVEAVRSPPPPSALSCLPPLSPAPVTPPPIPPLPPLSLSLLFLLLLLLLLLFLLSTVPSSSTVTSLDYSPRRPLVLEHVEVLDDGEHVEALDDGEHVEVLDDGEQC